MERPANHLLASPPNHQQFMLRTLESGTDLLVDDFGLPRFWAAAWNTLHGGSLAPSTLRTTLRDIDALYQHTANLGGDLDDALANIDYEVLHNALGSFFATISNAPVQTNGGITKWNTAFHFVKQTGEFLEKNPETANQMSDIRARMSRLDNLYLGLRPYKKRVTAQIRAIPRAVLLELLDAVMVGSPTNPFEYEETQSRVLCVFTLMLFQGLRQGEMLLLPADFLKSEFDTRRGSRRRYMSVRTDESEDDKRHSKPSIKTPQSIRTIPVTEQSAEVLLTYSDNYRGEVNHKFFLSSMHRKPLSKEGVAKIMQKLTTALSQEARTQLLDLTGAKNVTAQALRHTAAVVRMKQWLAAGKTLEQAMAKMRIVFGWSKNSTMPLHYAKAALDERLNDSWNEQLDDRLSMLRILPE